MLYNIYLHPLRAFPGPKLAACSFLYEFYFDVLKRGKYVWQIDRLHEKYGKRLTDLRSKEYSWLT
jgi:hypothetical protein